MNESVIIDKQQFKNADKKDLNGNEQTNFNFKLQTGKRSKKTKGRVKIKMEFIENKIRRYTTFSKRKTGIMKKVKDK